MFLVSWTSLDESFLVSGFLAKCLASSSSSEDKLLLLIELLQLLLLHESDLAS